MGVLSPDVMSVRDRLTDLALGSIVTLVTLPSGLGPAVGGWLAGRRTAAPLAGAVAGGLAGLLGALPWSALVFLASAGAIDPIGYHEGVVHVGVNPASPGALALWQVIGLTVLFAGTLTVIAAGGGLVVGLRTDVSEGIRKDASNGA